MLNKFLKISLVVILLSSCLKVGNIKIEPNTIPLEQNDDWEISTPQNEAINEAKLEAALAYFFSEEHLVNSKALLITRYNKLVLEAYSKDLEDNSRLHNIKSVTKSVSSVLTGIAIQQNILDSNLNRTVYSYIPENFDDNLEKRDITIEHCLRMTTGLEDPFYTVNPILPDNSVSTCLEVNLINKPGERHGYNNGSANIIGGVISKEFGNSFEKFTVENLFEPLNINKYHWVKHNDGLVNPAFDLYLYPRDVLKFGQFCLQNGNWNNKQITPSYWMQKSTQALEDGFDGEFGYHWWINEKYNGYYANGHGGQRVFVFPDYDLVIVHLAEPSTDDTDLSEIPILLDLIMNAVE